MTAASGGAGGRRSGAAAAPALAALLLLLSGGCSVRSLAINALAKALAASGDVFASDEDPELIREATPFALKTQEALLAEKPDHPGLLLSACRGFTQYAYAFVEPEAERLEEEDWAAAERAHERALKLYLRARDYCLRALELRDPGVSRRLERPADGILAAFDRGDVELLYWAGASWGSAISLGKDRPDLLADRPAVRLLLEAALERDEGYGRGAIHSALIVLDGLPETMGGSPERARYHFERAVELSGGESAAPYVSLAESVSVASQDWREFRELLGRALEIDPDAAPAIRVQNLITQQRARWLLERTGEIFLDYDEGAEELR